MRLKHRFGVGFIISFAIFGFASFAQAQFEGTYQVAIKKQEEKKASRWSVADWLIQKQKNRTMDLWLARNSHSSPFEFYIDAQGLNYGSALSATAENKINHNTYSGSLAAYAGIVGLRGGYEGDSEQRSNWFGSLNLRVFGRALQDTHINLEYGLRGMDRDTVDGFEKFQNQYGAVTADLYLTKYFGLEGSYRRLLPESSNQGRKLSGESSQAGVFIDFKLLRVFGNWRKEFLRFDSSDGSRQDEIREGFGGGLRFYF